MTDLTEQLLRDEITQLRAEVERLTDHRDHYLHQCGTLRARIAELEAENKIYVGHVNAAIEDYNEALELLRRAVDGRGEHTWIAEVRAFLAEQGET